MGTAVDAAEAASHLGLSYLHIPQGVPVGEFHGADDRVSADPVHLGHATGPVDFSRIAPIWVSGRVWRGGISVGSGHHPLGRNSRGDVSELTDSSLRRMRRYLEECQAEYLFMGTLTVGGSWSDDPADFRRAVDRWLTWFLRRQQKLAGEHRDRCSIFWFVEFQARGAPHLHLFYTHRVPWQQSARKWAELCFENDLADGDIEKFTRTSTKFETLRCGWRGTMAYATKYATKSQQKQVPEGSTWNGRFWGVRGLRSRGSCHAVGGYQPGAPVPSELMTSLDKAVESGVLRRFAWERGDGAVYFLRDGLRWRDVPELAAEVERWMCRLIDWGARDASGMHQPPE